MPFEIHEDDAPGRIPCQVIAKTGARTWRVVVGVGEGHLDGGVHHDVDEGALPSTLRAPNAQFFVSIVGAGAQPTGA